MIQPVVFQANAVNESGDVLPFASVYVVDSITNNPIDLFSDYEEIPTPILNPITADANGAFKFFCQRQVIDIIVTSGGFSRTWSDVFLQIPQLSSSNTGTSTTIAVTESGSEARSLRRKTEAAYWSGQQEFESAILSGSTSAEEITFGTPSGTKNSGGTAIIYGQLAINGNTNIKDLSEATDPKSLLNIGGVLKWGSNDLVTDDMLGTAAFLDAGINSGDVTTQTKGTWTPVFSNSYGTTITEGVGATYSATYTKVTNQAFIELSIDFDDALSSPVVGDRIRITGTPALLNPSFGAGVYSAGSISLYVSIGSGNNAIFDAAVDSLGDIYLTCMQVLGTVDYGTKLGGRISFMTV